MTISKKSVLEMLNTHSTRGSSQMRDSMDIHEGLKIISAKDGRELIDCRIYVTRRGGTYGYQFACAIWTHGYNGEQMAMFGKKTSGYGYDKISQAVSNAFEEGGLIGKKLFSRFGGTGTHREQLEKLADIMYGGKKYLVQFYG